MSLPVDEIDLSSISTIVLNNPFLFVANYSISSMKQYKRVMNRCWRNEQISEHAFLHKECRSV